MLVGYARVSSTGQELDSQIKALKAAGCEKLFTEKKSGKTATDRQALQDALEFVREGDTLLVTRLDRLARSMVDLSAIVKKLADKGVEFKCVDQPFETSSSTGKLMLNILGSIAEFETALRAERQCDGIAAAKQRGVKFGRDHKLTDNQVQEAIEMQLNGLTGGEIAKHFSVGRSTLLRYISQYKTKNVKNK